MEKTFIQWIEHINTGKKAKIKQFEYIANRIYHWYSTDVDGSKNNLGKVKIHKLFIFLICNNEYLLNIFSNIECSAFGRFESDIYNYMKRNDDYDYLTIDNTHTLIKTNAKLHILYEEVSVEFKKEVENAFRHLYSKNSKMVELETFDLIDIDRSYYTSKKSYNEATKNNKLVGSVSIKDMLIEDKIYHKSVF